MKEKGIEIMNQENKKAQYHIWDGEDLLADVTTNVTFPNGGSAYTKIGQLAIQKGDAIYLDFGRSMGVRTMSGNGYESEFKHGKVVLHGCPVHIVLQQGQTQFAKPAESTREEFDAKVAEQKARIEPQIANLTDVYIFEETQRRAEAKRVKAENDAKNKAKVQGAVDKMSTFFSKPK
jgi:hypothetical protein